MPASREKGPRKEKKRLAQAKTEDSPLYFPKKVACVNKVKTPCGGGAGRRKKKGVGRSVRTFGCLKKRRTSHFYIRSRCPRKKKRPEKRGGGSKGGGQCTCGWDTSTRRVRRKNPGSIEDIGVLKTGLFCGQHKTKRWGKITEKDKTSLREKKEKSDVGPNKELKLV